MREFVYGTHKQYDMLKDLLEEGNCEVYRCALPSSFSRSSCRLGFEKSNTQYKILIDKGITCNIPLAADHPLKTLLANGELAFVDYSDIKELMNSLKPYFN